MSTENKLRTRCVISRGINKDRREQRFNVVADADILNIEKDNDLISNVADTPEVNNTDSNNEIIELLKQRNVSYDNSKNFLNKINKRLEFGKNKYEHGIILNDDTKKYASKWDEDSAQNWVVMAYEELLDACIYLSAELLLSHNEQKEEEYITKIEKSLKSTIKTTHLLLDIHDKT